MKKVYKFIYNYFLASVVIMLFNFRFINKAPNVKIAPPKPTKLSPKLPTIIEPAAELKEIPKLEAMGLNDEAR
ncbi:MULTISPECIES: hypothetical protein [unclassified Companilactobacillus]|uniref:hypothetical protein n=1 Tax=unclassified Companilactobacillus TaxID=2767904 RepID=UPI002FF0751B